MIMKKTYEQLHKESGLKVGDGVKLLRKAKNWEKGWNNTWEASEMNNVGKVGIILADQENNRGFEIKFPKDEPGFHYDYPCFVLKKVSKRRTK
jgi:hypothetical protein